jgi:DNA-binding response OmpR family regulator
MPCVDSGKMGRPSESATGSGKSGTPWERMQLAKGSMPRRSIGTSAGGNWSSVPAGSSRWQAVSAALSWELLTRSCCAPGNFALLAPACGSGKLATPCARTQREKERSGPPALGAVPAPPGFDDGPVPADGGVLLQAAAIRATVAVAMMAAAACDAGGRARRLIGFMRQFYAGAGDISATGDVVRMSCRPAHTVQMRVLVAEDHVTLAGRIAEGLTQAGMAVDAVHDGAAALEAAAHTPYDVIVLDRDLPAVHGDRVCRTLAGSGPRILMLTAAAAVDDRVDGLELGADDYLPKPFAFAELVARVRALSRRAPSAPPVLHRADLAVDLARHRASRGGRPLSLTRKEFGILEMLMAAAGAVVSAEELLEHVWDASADPFSNIVSVTMTRLRRKLGDPPLIETVVGKGYRM